MLELQSESNCGSFKLISPGQLTLYISLYEFAVLVLNVQFLFLNTHCFNIYLGYMSRHTIYFVWKFSCFRDSCYTGCITPGDHDRRVLLARGETGSLLKVNSLLEELYPLPYWYSQLHQRFMYVGFVVIHNPPCHEFYHRSCALRIRAATVTL